MPRTRMKKKYINLIFILLYVCFVTSESVENCTVKEHLPCMLYQSITDCSPTSLEARFTFMRANDSWPGKASSFKPDNTEGTGTFTFTPPTDSSIKDVKGFAVILTRSDSTYPRCYVFDLSKATWKNGSEDFKTVFTITLFSMKRYIEYILDLYTLPRLPREFDKRKSLRLIVNGSSLRSASHTSNNDPQKWEASINFTVMEVQREVKVVFTAPPPKHNFTKFKVMLENITGGAKQKAWIRDTEYTFQDVVNGVYQITVQPYQESRTCNGCRVSNFVCKPCLTTPTKQFAIGLEKQIHIQADTKVRENGNRGTEGVNTVTVVLAVIGVVLLIILGGLIAFCYISKRADTEDEHENTNQRGTNADLDSLVTVEQLNRGTFVSSFNAERTILPRRLKVFILYEEDHLYHRKVVDKFAEYMQHHCYCDVMHVQLHDATSWVHQDFQNADYVLIVNSKLAYAIYHRLITKNQEEQETMLLGDIKIPEINCILLRCLQESHNGKTVMVYFDYTSEGLVIPDICPGYNYKLMKHFTDLLMHIQKLKRTDNLTQYDLPLDGKYYLKPIGKDLQRAIEETVSYERENPDWFAQKYGYLRSFSNASDESGYDSGLPQEPVFVDPVTAQLQSYLHATTQDAITVTPSMIADQDWPAFLAHNPCHNPPDDQHKHIQPRPIHDMELLPPTTNSGEQFEFIPPDDISDFETMSKTLSDQMMSINARNIGDSKKEYDWQQDLALLRIQNGEIPFIDS